MGLWILMFLAHSCEFAFLNLMVQIDITFGGQPLWFAVEQLEGSPVAP